MGINDAKIVTGVRALPIRARAAFMLALAEMVTPELAEDPQGLTVAQEALHLSWKWVGGSPVRGKEIEQYVESPTDKNLQTYQRHYLKKAPSMFAAMVVTHIGVAYAGYQAYMGEGVGEEAMSQPMAEVGEYLFDDVLEYAQKTSRYDEGSVHRVARFLTDRYAAQGQEALGSPVLVDQILPLLSGNSTAAK